jgi:hypothetical protein
MSRAASLAGAFQTGGESCMGRTGLKEPVLEYALASLAWAAPA